VAGRVGLRRSDVVEAACAVADELGFDAVTMSEVARRLGVKAQTIHAHMGSLDDLRRAVQLQGATMLRDQLHQRLLGLTGGEALVALVTTVDEFDLEHPGLSLVSSAPIPGEDQDLELILEDIHTMPRRFMAGRGLRDGDVTHYSRLVWVLLYGFLRMRRFGSFRSPPSTSTTLRRGIEAIIRDLEARAGQET